MEKVRLWIKGSLQTIAEILGYLLLIVLLINGSLELLSRYRLAETLISWDQYGFSEVQTKGRK